MKVTRYSPPLQTSLDADEHGDWVHFDDYMTLESRLVGLLDDVRDALRRGLDTKGLLEDIDEMLKYYDQPGDQSDEGKANESH